MRHIDLIRLTLDEIRKNVDCIGELMNDKSWLAKVIEVQGDESAEDIQKRRQTVGDYDEVLNRIRLDLRNVLEFSSNFRNDVSAYESWELSSSKENFDLIYDRKNEKDYEE